MEIQLKNINHFYQNREVFSPISVVLKSGSNTSIIGNNGSGKSTLLKIISSYITNSKGNISYHDENGEIDIDKVPNYVSICSPNLTLEDNFTLTEIIDFHFSLRDMRKEISKEEFFNLCYLEEAKNKKVKELSSGMCQRLKLALAFFTEASLLLLDEPCMNLDRQGKEMYVNFISMTDKAVTQVVASNSVELEYAHCTSEINLS